MKKAIFGLSMLALLASCGKDNKVEPITGYNSKIDIQNIVFHNVVGRVDSVKGALDIQYIVSAADTTQPPDTLRYTQPYPILNTPWNQSLDFNVPENAKAIRFRLLFSLYGTAGADSVQVQGVSLYRNNVMLLSQPVQMHNNASDFKTDYISYTY